MLTVNAASGFGSGGAGPYATTPFSSDGDTVLLIQSDTSDGSTTFTDASGSSHTITASGDAQHSTAQGRVPVGSSSIYFDGTGDYLSVPDHADFDFGTTGDFTIEYWIKTSNAHNVIGTFNNGIGAQWTDYMTNVVQWYKVDGGVAIVTQSTTYVEDDKWHHIAHVRSSGTQYLFIDGILEDTDTNTNDYDGDGLAVYIGTINYLGDPDPRSMTGYMDEIRISSTGRYTSNFTPNG